MTDLARRRDITQASIDRKPVIRRRSLNQNARFHALLGNWAAKSGQDATTLKHRVKDHLHAYTDAPVPNDPLTDQLLELVAKCFLALGAPDLMRLLPDRRCVRLYHSSAKFSVEQMKRAIDTVDLMAADEGYTLGPADNWDRTA